MRKADGSRPAALRRQTGAYARRQGPERRLALPCRHDIKEHIDQSSIQTEKPWQIIQEGKQTPFVVTV